MGVAVGVSGDRFYRDAQTGERRRHHLHESVIQRAVKDAVRAVAVAACEVRSISLVRFGRAPDGE